VVHPELLRMAQKSNWYATAKTAGLEFDYDVCHPELPGMYWQVRTRGMVGYVRYLWYALLLEL